MDNKEFYLRYIFSCSIIKESSIRRMTFEEAEQYIFIGNESNQQDDVTNESDNFITSPSP